MRNNDKDKNALLIKQMIRARVEDFSSDALMALLNYKLFAYDDNKKKGQTFIIRGRLRQLFREVVEYSRLFSGDNPHVETLREVFECANKSLLSYELETDIVDDIYAFLKEHGGQDDR